MKIVFLERNTLGEDVDLSVFEQLGEVVLYPWSEPALNAERCQGADVVVLNKIPVNETLLEGNDTVRLVCLTATGTNNVDFPYCEKRHIAVRNVAGYSTDSVAQHTLAMYLYLAEHMRKFDDYVRSGEYERCKCFTFFGYSFHELAGKTWGIVGLGNIGRAVADLAMAFGCRVKYFSTTGKHLEEAYHPVSLEELLETSDILSLHCPLTPDTEKLINADTLAQMKPNAVLLNLARGAVVDEAALADALEQKKIAAAGLDVLCVEPMSPENPLRRLLGSDNLLITPHVGWGTIEARQRCADMVAQNIKEFYQ